MEERNTKEIQERNTMLKKTKSGGSWQEAELRALSEYKDCHRNSGEQNNFNHTNTNTNKNTKTDTGTRMNKITSLDITIAVNKDTNTIVSLPKFHNKNTLTFLNFTDSKIF